MSSNKNKLNEQIEKLVDSYLSIQTHRRFISRAYLTLATKEYLEDPKEKEKLLDSHERLQDFLDFLEVYEKEKKKPFRKSTWYRISYFLVFIGGFTTFIIDF